MPTSHSTSDQQPSTTPRDDSQARVLACDVTQSWIVEAPAGSGKTELLMQRFLRLLTCVDQPEQVLAITFTNKAATEMRDRVLESLRAAKNHAFDSEIEAHKLRSLELARQALEVDTRLNWNLIDQPQRLNIRTIDSLCGAIAGRLPVLSQLGAEMRPIEDASDLYRTAARTALEDIGGGNQRLRTAGRALLLHLDNRMDRAVELLAGMLKTRDHWGHNFPIDEEHSDVQLDRIVSDRFERPLKDIAAEILKNAFQQLPMDAWQTVFRLARYASEVLENQNRPNIFSELKETTGVPDPISEQLGAWKAAARLLITQEGALRKQVDVRLGFARGMPETACMKTLLHDLASKNTLGRALNDICALPPATYSAQQREILRSSFLLLRRALAYLRVTFAESGTADFVEISLAAVRALRENSEGLGAVFGTAIQHLLVDEMQDTSIPQFELLRNLVDGWGGHSQTVFLVGDPKQSIYRFRHAEVGIFARAREVGIDGVRLNPLYLSSNFRSNKSLVEQGNRMFERIFADDVGSDQVRFEPSLATHEEPPSQRLFWHPRVREYDSGDQNPSSSEGDSGIAEAEEVCDTIERCRAESIPGKNPPTIAVLVRARSHVLRTLAEMRRRNIPYRAIDLDAMPDRQEMLDLLAITRCLLHPADRIAWLAVLRAPWCGLSLADLLALCGNDDPQWSEKTVPELFRERSYLLSPDGQRRTSRVVPILESALQKSRHERLASLVERTWISLGGSFCVPQPAANGANEFFRMLIDLERAHGWPTSDQVESRMKSLFAPPASSEEFPVEVLTLFKAKGLEWDVVLIPGLHRQPRNQEPELLQWMEHVSVGTSVENNSETRIPETGVVLLAPVKHAAEKKESIGDWICALEQERGRMELKRLLYVGCTRARREVHLFGDCKEAKPDEKTFARNLAHPDKRSLLHTAWPVAEQIFQQHIAADGNARHKPNVLTMPAPSEKPAAGVLESIAAADDSLSPDKTIAQAIPLSNFRRLSADWQPPPMAADIPWVGAVNRQEIDLAEDDFAPVDAFSRPHGSWRARIFGTTIHAFMEPLARLFATHRDSKAASQAITQMAAPIRLHLMRNGSNPQDAASDTQRILAVFQRLTADSIGKWILASHPAPAWLQEESSLAGFEVPVTAFHEIALRSVRLDRIFLAGDQPLTDGTDHLWIIDFKTAGHGTEGLDQFLAEQRTQYTGQMQTYANAVETLWPRHENIRLGLYFPLLTRLIWWQHSPAAPA